MRGAALLLVTLLMAGRAGAEELLIIANPSAPIASLSLHDVAEIYLLKKGDWGDGERIIPVNRESSSAVRSRFNAQVLRQDNAALSAYWNQMHFKGKTPPLIQESDQAMIAFVRKVPGAIGYISDARLAVDVKIIGKVP